MLLLENWLEPDLEWVWLFGGSETRLQLQFSPLADDEDEIHLGLDLEVYSGLLTRGPATLRFFADETEIATVIRAEAGFRPIILRIPRTATEETSFSCVLSIHAPVGISQYEVGESSDTRPLSFRVRTLHYMMPDTEETSPDVNPTVSAIDRQFSEVDNELSSHSQSYAPIRRPAILSGALDLIRRSSNGNFKGRHKKL